MSLENELYSIEQGFWLAGKEHFQEHLDEQCVLVFPQAEEKHGARSREEIAATASAPNRWRDLQVASRQHLIVTQDVSVISYRADVKRADGEPYSALVSSAYVRRIDGWKLAFHQHSPI